MRLALWKQGDSYKLIDPAKIAEANVVGYVEVEVIKPKVVVRKDIMLSDIHPLKSGAKFNFTVPQGAMNVKATYDIEKDDETLRPLRQSF